MGTPGFETPTLLKSRFENYWLNGSYDEMFESEGIPRPQYRALYEMLLSLPVEEMRRRKQTADISFLHQGITFTVYGREEGTERIFPNDRGSRSFAKRVPNGFSRMTCCPASSPAPNGKPSSAA